MDISTFAVTGGDMRSAILAYLLALDGYTVYAAGFDLCPEPIQNVATTDVPTAVSMAQAVILPVMPTTDGVHLYAPMSSCPIPLDRTLAQKLSGKYVFSGFCEKLRAISDDYNALKLMDYGREEAFLLPNARLTAEAALMLAISEYPAALYASNCLITGFGRIGKALAAMLYALGADVTVCARSAKDIALAECSGYDALDYSRLPCRAERFDMIFNTADAFVVDRNVISRLSPQTLIIDLASAPFGTDDDAAAEHSVRVIHAPGLPGKYSPQTAAEIIKNTVLALL